MLIWVHRCKCWQLFLLAFLAQLPIVLRSNIVFFVKVFAAVRTLWPFGKTVLLAILFWIFFFYGCHQEYAFRLYLPRYHLTCYRYRRHLAQILFLTISTWHVFERSSSCWTVYNFVHTILPILEMMPFITFHDFSINIRQRYWRASKLVSQKSVLPS